MPSHCHSLAPLGAGAPRFGCQPPASVTCPVGGRAALVTRDRLGCHTTEPPTAVPGVPQHGPTAALHPRRPPGPSKGTAGPGLNRPSIPSESRDGHRIRPHSLHKHCSPRAARGRLGGDISASPRNPAGAESRRHCRHLSPSVRPAGRGRKGFMEPGDCYLLK